jgi:hypothetical protein
LRATALTKPGPVDRLLLDVAATPAGRSTTQEDPHTNWTKTRGPVTRETGLFCSHCWDRGGELLPADAFRREGALAHASVR